MPRFYIEADMITDALVPLDAQDSIHAQRVLRLGVGDEVTACDGQNGQYRARLHSADKKQVVLELLEKSEMDVEPKTRITLFQAMPKGDKPEQILQKCTEVGVSSFCFFYSEFCVAKRTEKDKSARYSEIARQAAKQCGRGVLPSVNPCISFEELVAHVKSGAFTVFAYECEKRSTLKSALDGAPDDICLIVGSEGGFSPREAERLIESGARPVTLGRRILRAETAGVVLSALILHERGDMQ